MTQILQPWLKCNLHNSNLQIFPGHYGLPLKKGWEVFIQVNHWYILQKQRQLFELLSACKLKIYGPHVIISISMSVFLLTEWGSIQNCWRKQVIFQTIYNCGTSIKNGKKTCHSSHRRIEKPFQHSIEQAADQGARERFNLWNKRKMSSSA